MARPTRFERVASTFGGWRSIQLSYGRIDIQIVSETERGQSRIEQMHRRQTGRVLNLPNFAVRPLQPPLSLLPWRFRDLWMRLHASVEFRQSIGFARIFRPAHTSKRACLCLRRAQVKPFLAFKSSRFLQLNQLFRLLGSSGRNRVFILTEAPRKQFCYPLSWRRASQPKCGRATVDHICFR